jgi:hypothetical protein
MVSGKEEALAAGADSFLTMPETDFVPQKDLNKQMPLYDGLDVRHETADLLQKQYERKRYDTFCSNVISKLRRVIFKPPMNITTSLVGVSVTEEELLDLPGDAVGSVISIEGTLTDVNRVMRGVYFFAPNNTLGNATLTVSVTDHVLTDVGGAASFTLPSSLSATTTTATQAFYRTPNPRLPLFPLDGNLTASANMSRLLQETDTNQTHTVSAHITIFIQPFNQPPQVVLEQDNIAVLLDASIAIPAVAIVDVDHNETSLVDSFGFKQLPPVSVMVSAKLGRISFIALEGVTVPQGQPALNRIATLRGPLDNVNTALSQMIYTCRIQDGCTSPTNDTITIVADDEGFSGRGGPLTAAATVNVDVH